jgi:hypothetical protein
MALVDKVKAPASNRALLLLVVVAAVVAKAVVAAAKVVGHQLRQQAIQQRVS